MNKAVLLLVLGITSSVSGLSDELKEMIKMVHDTCVAESGTTDALIEGTRTGNFPDDRQLKCYIKCIYGNMGALDDDGVLDIEAIEALVPEEFLGFIPPAKKCKDTGGADACEVAFNFNVCVYNLDPKNYMII